MKQVKVEFSLYDSNHNAVAADRVDLKDTDHDAVWTVNATVLQAGVAAELQLFSADGKPSAKVVQDSSGQGTGDVVFP